jgi:Putative addiction module component
MPMDPSQLRDEALRLPLKARARLVDELLRSLDDDGPDDDEIDQTEHAAAWSSEVAERLREVDAGEVQTVPWSEARKRLRRRRKPKVEALSQVRAARKCSKSR